MGRLGIAALSLSPAGRGRGALGEGLLREAAEPSVGMIRQFSGQLAEHGRRSVERSIRRLEGRLEQHLGKLDEIVDRGGNPGSVVREIRNYRRQLEAARRVLEGAP
jgi:hypothetical protein